eukprot:6137669-Prymnesium_polylepis.2
MHSTPKRGSHQGPMRWSTRCCSRGARRSIPTRVARRNRRIRTRRRGARPSHRVEDFLLQRPGHTTEVPVRPGTAHVLPTDGAAYRAYVPADRVRKRRRDPQ